MSNRFFTLDAAPDVAALGYRFEVAFCGDVAEQIREDGGECPDDVHAASFTTDHPDDEQDGVLYFPHDVSLRIIVHEATHALIGLYNSRGMAVPNRRGLPGDEETFVETLGTLVEHIVETQPEIPGDGDGVE